MQVVDLENVAQPAHQEGQRACVACMVAVDIALLGSPAQQNPTGNAVAPAEDIGDGVQGEEGGRVQIGCRDRLCPDQAGEFAGEAHGGTFRQENGYRNRRDAVLPTDRQ